MKHSILFVDDDANLLKGLQRMLRGMRDGWDMTFVDGGRKALDLMSQFPFDVVVSDMRMPELDGATLLSQVERLYPGTMRVILSGYAEEKSLFRTVGPAHQYLAKPCEPEAIIALMERSLRLKGILNDQRLRDVAASLRNLPSPPDLYLRLTEAVNQDHTPTRVIADLISADVAMTAELLKITNSSYFSLSARITTASQAVRLLGLETVRSLVLYSGIFRQYAGKPGMTSLIQALSGHGLAIGQLAHKLAAAHGASETVQSQAQCAGMLSCIGALVLLDSNPDRYLKIAKQSAEPGLENSERKELGASNAELGAYLLGLWGFPDTTLEAVLYQLNPSACSNKNVSALTYLHLARALGPNFPLSPPPQSPDSILDRPYLDGLGLNETFWQRHLRPVGDAP